MKLLNVLKDLASMTKFAATVATGSISVFALVFALLSAPALRADDARFDLTGPKIDLRVTRGSSVLPIAEVPNLQPKDKLWIHADLPQSQSVHLLVIVAFLRGVTNPPPEDWFHKMETWDKRSKSEGMVVEVPEEAQQALIFIAPETGGDFSTLKSAVRGRPGLFVRAAVDLNEASFEQQRIERYLQLMRQVNSNDEKAILDRSTKLASTLNLKPNSDCFKQPVEQQVTCLRQSRSAELLNDGHGTTVASAVSSGASSDFINAAAATPMAGAGIYSAYVGAIVDLVRLTSGLHTAQYQYIPSIAFPEDQTLNLRLNAPPSFHNPKSVIVVGLPAIQTATPPPLHPHDADQVSCLLEPKLVLRLEGAPLVFATSFAHDMVLHINDVSGVRDIPLRADAFEGGLVLDNAPRRKPLHEIKLNNGFPKETEPPTANKNDMTVMGQVRGQWGFDAYTGPTIVLQQLPGDGWRLKGDTQLMAGTENHLILASTGAACVEKIAVVSQSGKGREVNVDFEPAPKHEDAPTPKNTLDLKVPLQKVDPGGYALHIRQFGGTENKLPITAYTNSISLDDLQLHSGDATAVLSGKDLQEVVSVELAGETFKPQGEATGDTLILVAAKGVEPSDDATAKVKLRDGRTMDVDVTVDSARPGLKVLSMNAEATSVDGAIPLTLGAPNDIPVNGTMHVVVQSAKVFPRTLKIEVATEDGSLHTLLSLQDSSLILQDASTAIATLQPLKAFGPSAFGTLQMRPVAEDGTAGVWSPLGKLVRAPVIQSVTCSVKKKSCHVTGSNLFLVDSFGGSADFTQVTPVPTGFSQNNLKIVLPTDGKTLFVKLRDDPSAPASLLLPQPLTPATSTKPADPANATPPVKTDTPAPTQAPKTDAPQTKEEAPTNPPAPTSNPTTF